MNTPQRPRLIVYCIAALYALGLFIVLSQGATGDVLILRLTKGFALGAVIALYLTLVMGPLYKNFPTFPWKANIIGVRGAIGNITLVFAVVHASFAFFKLLGGFAGWVFLGSTYQSATLFGLAAILGLLSLFIVSIGNVAQKVFQRFPWFGKIGYVIGLLVLVHALIIGSHFRDWSTAAPRITFICVSFLLVLLGLNIDQWIKGKWHIARSFSFGTIAAIFAIIYMAAQVFPALFGAKSEVLSQNLHQQHLQQIQALEASGTQSYTLSLNLPPEVDAGKTVPLKFAITRAATGSEVTEFDIVHEKLAHLVIVDDSLTYYNHIHPELKDGTFTITTAFPLNGNYRLYLSAQPKGGVEQVFTSRVAVGSGQSATPSLAVDATSEKTIGAVKAKIATTNLTAAGGLNGSAKIVYELTDASGAPLSNLYPYLGAFGHLVMISTTDYSYIHVHPSVTPFSPEETSGPKVEFMVAGSLKSGIYKLFGQFAPNKEVVTIPFTVEVTP